jgi:5'-3' exonuclease
MGVPGLWPFLQEKFRYAIINFQERSKRFKFDYVYLDANGLLHAAAQIVFNYGDKKRFKNPYANLSYEEKLVKVFEMFFEKIVDIVYMTDPQKVLYIAIDGPAPRAKQDQQRERRYATAKEREEKAGGTSTKDSSEEFDPSSISPGTEFMHNMSTFMYWRIRDMMMRYEDWKQFKVIYSPPTVAGEGEHKIMDYIRGLPQKEKYESSHCMFGPDGDLIMLTLSIHIRKMFLFREGKSSQSQRKKIGEMTRQELIEELGSYDVEFDVSSSGIAKLKTLVYKTREKNPVSYNKDIDSAVFYDLVNTSKVMFNLLTVLEQKDATDKKIRTYNDVVDDFVFIGFFVGNDFLPKIKMFYLLSKGIKTMIDTYIKTTNSGKKNFISKNRKILIDGLREFIHELAKHEESFLAEQVSVEPKQPEFEDKTLKKFVTRQDNGKFVIDFYGYRKAYYLKAGISDNQNFNDRVSFMCRDYLRNLIWVYKYYVHTLPSWSDAYDYHYAPFMGDLYSYVSLLTQINIDELSNFEKGSPVVPFQQLLSILSPYSSSLLPQHYAVLLTDKKSPLILAGFVPKNFEIDYEGVDKEHKGVALLPFVDEKLVHKVYENALKSDKFWYHRNTPGKYAEFEYLGGTENSIFLVDFSSKYGNVFDCKIKVNYFV